MGADMVRTIQHKEKIGEADCPSCGKKLDVRVNRQQCVYTICTNVRRVDEKGKSFRCRFSTVYGPDHSRIMIEEFLAKESGAKERKEIHDESEHRAGDQPAGKPAASGPPAVDGKRGIIGTILFGEE